MKTLGRIPNLTQVLNKSMHWSLGKRKYGTKGQHLQGSQRGTTKRECSSPVCVGFVISLFLGFGSPTSLQELLRLSERIEDEAAAENAWRVVPISSTPPTKLITSHGEKQRSSRCFDARLHKFVNLRRPVTRNIFSQPKMDTSHQG